MRLTVKIFFLLSILYTLGISCSSDTKECAAPPASLTKPLNPNGDSELALLMRAMYDEAAAIKKQIAAGEPVTLTLDYDKILTAHATEPEKAASPEFQAFAKTYIQIIDRLPNAAPEQQLQLYDNLVNTCMSCHKALCPGPIVRIKKLL